MQIRPMLPADLSAAVELVAGNGWGGIPEQFAFMSRHPECHLFVAESGSQIIGTAVATQRGTAGWVGMITVAPEARGRGLGTALTRHVMAVLTGLGCQTLLLFATEMGRPIYEQLGFVPDTEFVLRAGPGLVDLPEGLRPITPADLPWICALDRAATGQDRAAELGAFAHGGWAVADQGFLIPTSWGTQAMAAATPEAGRVLLDAARAVTPSGPDGVRLAMPADNRDGAAYLLSHGFQDVARMPRMVLGAPLQWEPAMVYGRMSGAME